MKKSLLLVLLMGACALSAVAQSVEANLIDAVTLYGNGQYQKAEKILQTLSVAAPEEDAVWYYLALTQLRDQPESARASLEKAVALDSGNYWYRRTLVRLYLMAGEAQKGLELQEALVKDFPDKSSAQYDLLDLYLNQRAFEQALDVLADIERQRGPSEELVRTRFEVYSALGRQEEGVAVLEQYNEQYSSPALLSMLGDYYLADFADSLAQARYEEALALDSAYIPAVLGISEVYRHQRRYPDYFRTLEPFFSAADIPAASKSMYLGNLTRSIDPKILQLHREGFDHLAETAGAAHPADTLLLTTLGRYYYATGREDNAGNWFRRAADAGPESLQLTVTYVQYLAVREQWDSLRTRSLAAFDRFGQLGFLDYANMASYQLADYEGVIGQCRQLVARYPREKTVCLGAWSQMGDAYHALGNAKDAYKAYEKALRIDPAYAPVLNNYAYYLSLEGKKLKKAYNMSKKTVEANPDNATYLDTFAWILHLMGKDLEAKPFFKHAMLYGGKDSAVILDHYATVLEALGENDMARLYRNQAQARAKAEEKP